MRITFEDKSFIEIQKSKSPGKVMVVIGARDPVDALKNVINSVEITRGQLQELVSSVDEAKAV